MEKNTSVDRSLFPIVSASIVVGIIVVAAGILLFDVKNQANAGLVVPFLLLAVLSGAVFFFILMRTQLLIENDEVVYRYFFREKKVPVADLVSMKHVLISKVPGGLTTVRGLTFLTKDQKKIGIDATFFESDSLKLFLQELHKINPDLRME